MSFSITETKYNLILSRLTALENTLNDSIIAIGRLATINQVHELLVITQTDISSLTSKVEALEERVTAIEEEPIS
jgi:polyhydroxyalkanoate synthesis regulator phasin